MAEEFKIVVGASLDSGQFDSIESKIKELCNNDKNKIKFDIKVSNSQKLKNLEQDVSSIRKSVGNPLRITFDTTAANQELENIETRLRNIRDLTQNIPDNNDNSRNNRNRTNGQRREISRQYSEAMSLQRRMAQYRKLLSKTDPFTDTDSFSTYRDQIDELQIRFNSIMGQFGNRFTDRQRDSLRRITEQTTEQIDQVQAKFQDTLRNDLSNGKYTLDANKLYDSFAKLSNPTEDVARNVELFEKALANLRSASLTGTYESQIQALNAYNNALENANTSIKLFASYEKSLSKQKEIRNRYKGISDSYSSGDISIEVNKLEESLDKIKDKESLTNLAQQLKEVKQASLELGTMLGDGSGYDDVFAQYKKYQSLVEKFNNTFNGILSGQNKEDYTKNLQRQKQSFSNEIDSWLKDNSAAANQFGEKLADIKAKISDCNGAQLDSLKGEFLDVVNAAESAGVATKTFGDKLKDTLKGEFFQAFSISRLFDYAVDAMRDMFDNVVEVDSAMINLRKVTDETDSTYNNFLKDSSNNAIKLGRSMSSYINQTADWVKLGYSLSDAEILAEKSSIYANVAEIDDATAVSDMVTAMKAYNIEAKDATQITDALNELGNKFATDAGALGTGLTKAAASMSNAGTDLNHTLAMLTGGTEITQNADEFGSFLKVASMRIRGMKGELEELGEEVDSSANSISKVQTQILNITKGTSKPVNIFDDSGEFRNYYDIMEDISSVYDELSSTDKASLDEILFGKMRANQGAALMKAFQSGQVQKAYETAANSAGSAAKEQEAWMQGLEASMASFDAAWQHLSTSMVDSGFIGKIINGGTDVVEFFADLIDGAGALNTALLGAGITDFLWNLD